MVFQALNTLLTVISDFCAKVHTQLDSSAAELQASSSSNPNSRGKGSAGSSGSNIGRAGARLQWKQSVMQTEAEFTRQVCFLVTVLGRRSSLPGGQALAALLLQLDYNKYFTNVSVLLGGGLPTSSSHVNVNLSVTTSLNNVNVNPGSSTNNHPVSSVNMNKHTKPTNKLPLSSLNYMDS